MWCQQTSTAASYLGEGWLLQRAQAPPAQPCWEAAAPWQPRLGCHLLLLLVPLALQLGLAALSSSSSPSPFSSFSQGTSCSRPGQAKGDEGKMAEALFSSVHPIPSRSTPFHPVHPFPPLGGSPGAVGGGRVAAAGVPRSYLRYLGHPPREAAGPWRDESTARGDRGEPRREEWRTRTGTSTHGASHPPAGGGAAAGCPGSGTGRCSGSGGRR